ncbi:unnamed protein product [Parnassius apollo]|uniref:(apollo) hypothetical protein n=1 Tax=Parnassius apollo TaxID=110799 RepID=A0A8S3W4U1_PARAO|nr:unnamed protein product [Parnassius apollo]
MADGFARSLGYTPIPKRNPKTERPKKALRTKSDMPLLNDNDENEKDNPERRDDESEPYEDLNDDNETTTVSSPSPSMRPATAHSKAGNWSTILYYLL